MMSITLTTGRVVTINGIQQENDTQGIITGFTVDYLLNIVTFNLHIGIGAPSAFSVGAYDTPISVAVNLTTGAWASFDIVNPANNKAGTFSGAAFTNFVANMKSTRNMAETFASGASGILPGTQVPWV